MSAKTTPIKKRPKKTSQRVRIMKPETWEKVSKNAPANWGLTDEDFLREYTTSCVLGPDDFRGSVADHRLKYMFYDTSERLELRIDSDGVFLIPRGIIEITFEGDDVAEGVSICLQTGNQKLAIDGVPYMIDYRKFGRNGKEIKEVE